MTRAWRRFWRRSRDMFSRGRRERELQAELDSLHGLEADAQAARGLSQAEALRAAKLRLGGTEQLRELGRQARGWPGLETWARDAGYGLRRLRRAPGFTLTVVAILALGVGANTAIFSLFDSLLLRPLPVRDPQHLLLLRWHAPEFPRFRVGFSMPEACAVEQTKAGASSCSFSYPLYGQLRDSGLFAGLAGFTGEERFTLSGAGLARASRGRYVSGNYFQVLGLRAELGRLLGPGDDQAGASAVVISDRFWRDSLNGEPGVMGRTIVVNGQACTIVGVAEAGFTSLVPGDREDLWLPLAVRARVAPAGAPEGDGFAFLLLVGRLRPGVQAGAASAGASAIWNNWLHRGPEPPLPAKTGPGSISLPSVQDGMAGSRTQYGPTLWILLMGVGVLLAITCANVAGLLLAQSAGRRREVALRRALGAGRGRIFRQLMIEAAWLAALGGVAGLWIAWWGGRSLLALLSAGAADAGGLAVVLDGRVLTFTAVCALGAGLLFGLVPALRGARQPLAPVMQSEAGASRPRLRLASLLVVAQVGLSLVLLAGAGVLVLTLHNLQQSDPGFKAQGLITFGLHPSQLGYRRAALPGLYGKLAQRLAAIPGVEGVGYSTEPLLSPDLAAGFSERIFTRADGQKILPKELGIGPGYLATLGVPLQAGRYLLASDLDTAQGQPTPVLINQKFAQDWFVNASPIGQILRFNARDPGARIVGVVGNTLFESQREAPAPEIFVPGYGGAGYFTLRSRLPVSALLPAVRGAVAAVDRNLPLYNPQTQLQNQAQLLAQEKMLARLGGLFAGLALLLSAIGLYGLLAFEVVQRRRELGIRMVMGARPAHLLRGVALRTLGLTGAGLLLGLAGAWAALGTLSHWLYQVAPLSPRALVPAAVLLLAAAAAASVLPVRRALRSDPAEVLRAE